MGKYWVQSSQVVQWERIHQSMQETQEMWVPSLSQEDTLEEEMATGKSHGQSRLASFSPKGHRVGYN